MTRLEPLLCLALLSMSSVAAAEAPGPACRHSRFRVGQCFTLHGRMAVANGTPGLRIWRVGTKRILGVFSPEYKDMEDDRLLPAPLPKLMAVAPFNTRIYADFDLCPFRSARRGWMRNVCIASARKIVVERRLGDRLVVTPVRS